VGEAVELGCAFGRFTAATLHGLAANPRAAGRDLHLYRAALGEVEVPYRIAVVERRLVTRTTRRWKALSWWS
jgi:hypothetical protein